ncbi:MAG: PP0621 family protein [Polaromonas sp.]|jgi:uncharacterized protein|uniref:PP0621 family protein n=1 Tax=Polaromonas sp. TaxID=1869339 RepID=UPI002731910C|nr:PP0621 family protein [Polaromonas sp.]MDP2258036.1 PP0621 family protein [Polaromonas sp.]MDP3709554.1 PP0621 family protein [Polaromonas sp.]
MKYLLVTALVLVVFWLWRHNRQAERKAAQSDSTTRPSRAAKSAQATEVVACDVCQVHLPRSEAVTGRKGLYCSEAHRRQAGD